MSTGPDDRDELERYLEGDSELSRAYRAGAAEEPPAHLDRGIRLAAARRARAARPAHGPFSRSWVVPASLAAVLVLSVSVVVLMAPPGDDGVVPALRTAPEPAAPALFDRMDGEPAGAKAPAAGREAEKLEAAPPAEPPAAAQPIAPSSRRMPAAERAPAAQAPRYASPPPARDEAAGDALGEQRARESVRKAAPTEQDSAAGLPAPSPASDAPAAGASGDASGRPSGAASGAGARSAVQLERDEPEAWLRAIEALLDAGEVDA
ncbi:MAG: hypothetical protein R3286_19455, partial [Gammaproteobacteria bacterium]|nr:hypothetical protein [Gammaproteobacteria bacterium]